MNKSSYLSRLLKISFILLIYIAFASCSQNLPEVKMASGSVVFEYEDQEQAPNARFGVFVEAESNPQRFSSMRVKSEEKGFEWETSDIIVFKEEDRTMAGYSNFVMPEGHKIPTGKYIAVYENADHEEIETDFYIDYNEKYYELKASEVPAFMKKSNGLNRISIYDDKEILIYFGDRTGEFRTTRDIWNKFQNAETFNDIWCENGKSVICVLPKELVKPEKVKTDETEETTGDSLVEPVETSVETQAIENN